jgi:A/G-specific adenine glycosylase
LAWRQPEADGTFDPYKIWVSELMLQQTQVGRVIPKYVAFLHDFPTLEKLASAPLSEVLIAWQGLGYNRRAKFLWQAAQEIVRNGEGVFPSTLAGLMALPGIGQNTAGAILAYAFNRPAIFVETNIRTVYFHHFFQDREAVSDKEITELLEQTIDKQNPREFYWALMDYGTYLKQQGHGKISRSRHYKKQSAFEGSVRQIRGRVLRALAKRPHTGPELLALLDDSRAPAVLTQLQQEKLITAGEHGFRLA